ncbi:MAG TPA: manganese-binding transcriptional regulator MntR [Planctomycetota bacterium]|nr:manganese-binding transcriptional regulator MntR [Planctomycetota bacterium]
MNTQKTARRKGQPSADDPLGLLRPELQADIHRRTRSAHDEERSQDYVETIADLIDTSGEARAVEIARRMGVTHVTVIKTIARLQRDGFVTTRPYRSIFLTDEGRKLAEEARRRHATVLEFLVALGVKPATAAVDAEGLEHHVSDETLDAFKKFLRKNS